VGSLHQAEFVLAGLDVHPDAMLANLQSTRGLIVGEAVMMALATHIGRQDAHDVVYEACKKTIEGPVEGSLLASLQQDSRVTNVIAADDLESLCDPTKYLGSAQTMVDQTLAYGKQDRQF